MAIVKGGTNNSTTAPISIHHPTTISSALATSLVEFTQTYFRANPLFRDAPQAHQSLFRALVGGKKLRLWKTLQNMLQKAPGRRYKQKHIQAGPLIPEAEKLVQGAVLVFDRLGNLRCLIPEETYGVELDMSLVEAAVHAARMSTKQPSSPQPQQHGSNH